MVPTRSIAERTSQRRLARAIRAWSWRLPCARFRSQYDRETGSRSAAKADTRPGQIANLVREPGKEHDPFAIAVFADAVKVGYLPKMMARLMAKQLDVGIVLHAMFLAGARTAAEAGRVRVIAAEHDTLELLQSTPPRPQPTRAPAVRAPASEHAEGVWFRVMRAFVGENGANSSVV